MVLCMQRRAWWPRDHVVRAPLDLDVLVGDALHTTSMSEPSADTLATLAAGRTAAVTQLRQLAAALEALPLDAVAEVLVLLEPALDDLQRQAAVALERAPAGN
jgi:hypothetical protein